MDYEDTDAMSDLPLGCLDALTEYLAATELENECEELETETLAAIEALCSR